MQEQLSLTDSYMITRGTNFMHVCRIMNVNPLAAGSIVMYSITVRDLENISRCLDV